MEAGTTWNANPIVQEISSKKRTRQLQAEKRKAAIAAWFATDTDSDGEGEIEEEPIDEEEIFGRPLYDWHTSHDTDFTLADLIRSINDPEHPHTLENLLVVSQGQIRLKGNLIQVEFTPTVPHCGMATIIGKLPLFALLSFHSPLSRSMYKGETSQKPARTIQSRHRDQKRYSPERKCWYVSPIQAPIDS